MSPPIGDMHHVGIAVRDLGQAEAFATEVLGLPVVNRLDAPEHGVRATFVACGTGLVELVRFTDPEVARARLGDRAAAIDHIALRVDDVERAAEALAAHGVATVTPTAMRFPGVRTHFTASETSAGVIWQLLEASRQRTSR